MVIIYLKGFALTGGLIIAIGAQNAFVLSQSVRNNHPVMIATICAFCDVLLISIGLTGVGTLVASDPGLIYWASWGGALFLIYYGANALRSAIRGNALETTDTANTTRSALIATTLAVTFLNPHAWLDTVVLIGSIGGQLPWQERLIFGLGSISASFSWFFTLGFGGPFLAPLFRKPVSWRILDGSICLIMWGIAYSLLQSAVKP